MHPIIALVALPLLLFLPGFVTLWGVLLRLPGQSEESNRYRQSEFGSQSLDLIERIGLSVSASFLLSSIVAFILALLGLFSLWLLLLMVGAYVALVIAVRRRINRHSAQTLPPRFRAAELWIALVAIVAVAASLILYSRYSEYVLLYRDHATYVNTGVNIAKSGGSLVEDSLFYSLEDDLQTALVYERPVDSVKEQSGGFQIEYRLRGFPRDAGLGQTTPQFFNLLPIWMAIGYSMFGMWGIFMVSPLFGALSVLFIFLVGRRLFGSVAGIAAAVLLLVNLAQFWYARAPASEVMTQMTFLGALLFWILFSTTRDKFLGVFAGIGFGALILIRVDSVLILGAIGVFFLYLAATRRIGHRDLFFILPLIFVAILGLVDALYSSRFYVEFLYKSFPQATTILGGFTALAAMAVLIGAFPRLGVSSLIKSLESNLGARLRLVLAFGLIGGSVFAYLVRPEIQESFSFSLLGQKLPTYAEETFVRLGWYVSPLGIILMTIGGAVAVSQRSHRGLSLFLLTTLSVTFFYLSNLRVYPDHFWAARRYVPVILPMSMLFIGFALQVVGWGRYKWPWSSVRPDMQSSRAQARHTLSMLLGSRATNAVFLRPIRWAAAQVDRKVIAVGLFAALFTLSVDQISEFVLYRDQQGSVSAVEQVAKEFPEDAVIVFEYSRLGGLLAPPLKLIHGLETFVLGPPGASDSYRTLCGSDSEYPSHEDPESCIVAKLATKSAPSPFFWVSQRTEGQPRFVEQAFTKLDGPGIKISVPWLEEPMTRLPKRSNAGRINLAGFVYQLDRGRIASAGSP